MAGDELQCPSCGGVQRGQERFCEQCGMPLVLGGAREEPLPIERHARRIKPQYSEGPLVKVASAPNQAQAEFIAGLLLAEGIPSMLRRSASFDVPEALVGGARDVLVPRSGAQAASEALTWERPSPADGGGEDP
ncbi:MAG TPA: hypothetical protein VFW29_00890 [Solirubrobacteraceae bacterium]|nr:hypothetical protein [Solirubrobacteraceae bacterium]